MRLLKACDTWGTSSLKEHAHTSVSDGWDVSEKSSGFCHKSQLYLVDCAGEGIGISKYRL